MAIKKLFGDGIGFGSIGDVVRLGFAASGGAPPVTGPWYIANAGSNANDGNSALLPWQTMAKAISGSTTADTINWNGGDVWREQASSVPTAQAWQAYGVTTTLPKLSCMDVIAGTWTSTTPTNTWSIAMTPAFGNVTAVNVNGTFYPKAASQAALVVGQFFWASNVLYLCLVGGSTSMAGFVIEANGTRSNVFATTTGGSYTFRQMWFEGGTNGTVIMQNNTSASQYQSCRFGHGGATTSVGLLFLQAGLNTGNTINDCLFENGITDCLFINDNPSTVVSYTTFRSLYGSVSDHIQFGGSSGGSGLSVVHHCYHTVQNDTGSTKGCIVVSGNLTSGAFTFRDNFMDGGNYAASMGNAADTGQNNHQILRNIGVNQLAGSSVGTFGQGCAGDGWSWLFNVSLNSAVTGLNLFGTVNHTHCTIVNNTFYGYALRGLTSGSGTDKISGTVEDNIVYGAASTSNQMRLVDGVSAQALVSDYNDIGPVKAAFVSYNGTTYSTLALYQAGASQDAHSITGDPLLNVASNRTAQFGQQSAPITATFADVAPTALSPARRAGLTVVGVNDGLANPPDMGAFQFGANGPGIPGVTGTGRRRLHRIASLLRFLGGV